MDAKKDILLVEETHVGHWSIARNSFAGLYLYKVAYNERGEHQQVDCMQGFVDGKICKAVFGERRPAPDEPTDAERQGGNNLGGLVAK